MTDFDRWIVKTRRAPAPIWLEGRGDCLIWTGSRSRRGAGKFWAHDFPGINGRVRRDRGRCGAAIYAHRFGVVFLFGPEALHRLHGDHLCLRPACVSPLHVLPEEPRVNIGRGNVTRHYPADPFAELGW